MDGHDSSKVAVITGATGWTGSAVARVLSGAGYSLVLTAPSMEQLSNLASQLSGPCTVVSGHLSDESLPETLLYAALDRFGRCDVCLNNGALFEGGLIETTEMERLCNMVRVNVEGTFRIAYSFLKHFAEEGSGHLINVSSRVGRHLRPTAYSATQRAIEVLSDALIGEVTGTNVHVTCIQPGLIKMGLQTRWEITPEKLIGVAEPLEPEDFARVVLYILEQSTAAEAGDSEKARETA